jgi:hypothetical protein
MAPRNRPDPTRKTESVSQSAEHGVHFASPAEGDCQRDGLQITASFLTMTVLPFDL